MKNILIPVDFSEEAANAAFYAAQLAKQFGAELTLMYVFRLPIAVSEVPYPVDFVRIEEENRDLLSGLAKQLEIKYGVKAHQVSVSGFADDEILEKVASSGIDLVVIGMKGAGRKLSFLLGSTATAVMKKSPVPVLAIPGDATFKIPGHILLTSDFQKVNHPEIFKTLTVLCKHFRADVSLLNVIKPGELPQRKKAMEGIRLETYLEGVDFQFEFEEEGNVETGVERYLNKHPADLLVIVPHQHSIMERLFYKTHSAKLMLHASIPVLALPDKVLTNA